LTGPICVSETCILKYKFLAFCGADRKYGRRQELAEQLIFRGFLMAQFWHSNPLLRHRNPMRARHVLQSWGLTTITFGVAEGLKRPPMRNWWGAYREPQPALVKEAESRVKSRVNGYSAYGPHARTKVKP